MLIMYHIYYDKKIVFLHKPYSIFINGFPIIFSEDYKPRLYNKPVCHRLSFPSHLQHTLQLIFCKNLGLLKKITLYMECHNRVLKSKILLLSILKEECGSKMYHFRDTSSQSVLKNFSYCLFSSVYFQSLFINQCPLIFIVYPPMFLFFYCLSTIVSFCFGC